MLHNISTTNSLTSLSRTSLQKLFREGIG